MLRIYSTRKLPSDVDHFRFSQAFAEKFIGIVDSQTDRPAITAGQVDALLEDQLSGCRVEDIDATDRGIWPWGGERHVEEAAPASRRRSATEEQR
jgi:hypothetical protein